MKSTVLTSPQERAELRNHRLFLLTILGKGLLGVIQLATAVAIQMGLIQALPAIAKWVFKEELADDPKDFLATKIVELAGIIPQSELTFYTVYFAAHGALHVCVVAALLYGARWAYHAAIFVLAAFVVYQMIEWFSVGGAMLLVLTAIDLAVIYLTVLEEKRKQKHGQHLAPKTAPANQSA